MRKELGKNDLEFVLFQDFWNLYKEFHDVERKDEYWESVIAGWSAFIDRYNSEKIPKQIHQMAIDLSQAVMRKLEADTREEKK